VGRYAKALKRDYQSQISMSHALTKFLSARFDDPDGADAEIRINPSGNSDGDQPSTNPG
jgi:hypothetical protein